MKILLKLNWDIPVQPPDNQEIGLFIGREREISFLTNEILRKNQGAILVSGHRGVGKTSLVFKSLRSIKSQKILPVIINASHLEPEDNNPDEINYAKQILINLIRRLYSASKHARAENTIPFKETYNKIEKLYKKAVATNYEALGQVINTEENKVENEKKFEFNFSTDILSLSIWLIGFSLSAASISTSLPEPLKVFLSLLFAVPLPLIINQLIFIRKYSENKTDFTKSTAEELYTIDNNVGILAYDLEEVHKDLSKRDIKVVYVVDELDKLDENISNNKTPPKFIKIFKHFKNFFNLSSAIFIFIGGEDTHQYFDIALKNQNTGTRTKEYTYFSSKYFLARPLIKDLNEFIDEIVENFSHLSSSLDKDKYQYFKNLLFFSSRGDFFDLLQQIRDRISYFDGKTPIIEVNTITADEKLKATMQKALSVIFDKYLTLNPSRWHENELILRSLYEIANQVIVSGSIEHNNAPANSIFELSKREFIQFLHRLGALNSPVTERVSTNDRQQLMNLKYTFTGKFKSNVPDQYDYPTELETSFIEEMDKVIDKSIYLNNLFLLLRDGNDNLLSKSQYVPDTLREYLNRIYNWGIRNPNLDVFTPYQYMKDSPPPYKYNRDEIENFLQRVKTVNENFEINKTLVFSNILQESFPDLSLQISDLVHNKNVFADFSLEEKEVIKRKEHKIVFNRDFSKQVLVLSGSLEIKSKEFKLILQRNYEKYKIVELENEVGKKIGRETLKISLFQFNEYTKEELVNLKEWFNANLVNN